MQSSTVPGEDGAEGSQTMVIPHGQGSANIWNGTRAVRSSDAENQVKQLEDEQTSQRDSKTLDSVSSDSQAGFLPAGQDSCSRNGSERDLHPEAGSEGSPDAQKDPGDVSDSTAYANALRSSGEATKVTSTDHPKNSAQPSTVDVKSRRPSRIQESRRMKILVETGILDYRDTETHGEEMPDSSTSPIDMPGAHRIQPGDVENPDETLEDRRGEILGQMHEEPDHPSYASSYEGLYSGVPELQGIAVAQPVHASGDNGDSGNLLVDGVNTGKLQDEPKDKSPPPPSPSNRRKLKICVLALLVFGVLVAVIVPVALVMRGNGSGDRNTESNADNGNFSTALFPSPIVTLSPTSKPTQFPSSSPTKTLLPWSAVGDDIDGAEEGDWSGISVSLSANGAILAIGSSRHNNRGHTRIFSFSDNGWTQIGQDIDGVEERGLSGWHSAISADGTIVAVGSRRHDDVRGSVRVFQYSIEKNWTQIGDTIFGEAEGDGSGNSIALSMDGTLLAIGAADNDGNGEKSGHARVYQYDATGGWTQRGRDIDGVAPGDSSGTVALSPDGKILAVGAESNGENGENSGHVRVFSFDEAIQDWVQIGNDILGEGLENYFGGSVSLNYDGSIIAVGAKRNSGSFESSGHVRVFEFQGEVGWKQIGADIDGVAAEDFAGDSVSLSWDGTLVAVGAFGHDGIGQNSGHVRIFRYTPERGWRQRGMAIDGEAEGDESGRSISMSSDGSRIAIGARWNDGMGDRSGHVRVLEYIGTDE